MRIELVFRFIGMIALAAFGVYWGIFFADLFNLQILVATIILCLVGAVIGFLIAPYVTTRPAIAIRSNLSRVSAQTLVAGLIGLMAGLIIAALSAYPLSSLPTPFGEVLPFISLLIFGYLGIMVFVMRQDDILAIFKLFPGRTPSEEDANNGDKNSISRTILLDTSVIIDGRIADIAQSGFLYGKLLIPRFVLNELQYIADSADTLRRQRGRRGLEVLTHLQKEEQVPVQISDIDVDGVKEVDEKLVVLARQLDCPIMTNDYNLNQVAEIQGVMVLNVNELANAVKSVFLPGETLTIEIIQEGREPGQGIAYLEDGTMVVVEDGRDHIKTQANVTVTKVLQTAAGRMIFSRIRTDEDNSGDDTSN